TFHASHDGPVQQIAGEGGAFYFEDASEWSEERVTDWLAAEAHRPFDLERGPVVKAYVLKRSPAEYNLLLVIHHLVGDFWSVTLVLREIGILYSAAIGGEPALLPEIQAEYCEYVSAEAEFLSGPEGRRQAQYWREQLACPLPPLLLPGCRRRPAAQTFIG